MSQSSALPKTDHWAVAPLFAAAAICCLTSLAACGGDPAFFDPQPQLGHSEAAVYHGELSGIDYADVPEEAKGCPGMAPHAQIEAA